MGIIGHFNGRGDIARAVSNWSKVLTGEARWKWTNAFAVLGCPEVSAPNGSYMSNGTLTSRTFLCKSGSVFPDSRERKRMLECRNGKWNETAAKLPGCIGKNLPDKSIMFRSAYFPASYFTRSAFIGHSVTFANPRLIICIRLQSYAPITRDGWILFFIRSLFNLNSRVKVTHIRK